MQNFGEETSKGERPRRIWKYDVIIDLRRTGCESWGWTELAQDRVCFGISVVESSVGQSVIL
jgi:hypothetical protein